MVVFPDPAQPLTHHASAVAQKVQQVELLSGQADDLALLIHELGRQRRVQIP
ncbi:MAG: hypothetical protein V9H69_21140 [Anaerolineae bacterium]